MCHVEIQEIVTLKIKQYYEGLQETATLKMKQYYEGIQETAKLDNR